MRISLNVFKAVGSLFGGGEAQSAAPQYFKAPPVDNSRQLQEQAADEAKRKSQADAAARVGSASSLLTSPDTDFTKVGGKKTLLGGA